MYLLDRMDVRQTSLEWREYPGKVKELLFVGKERGEEQIREGNAGY